MTTTPDPRVALGNLIAATDALLSASETPLHDGWQMAPVWVVAYNAVQAARAALATPPAPEAAVERCANDWVDMLLDIVCNGEYEQDAAIGRAADALGLEWHDEQNRYVTTARTVRTPCLAKHIENERVIDQPAPTPPAPTSAEALRDALLNTAMNLTFVRYWPMEGPGVVGWNLGTPNPVRLDHALDAIIAAARAPLTVERLAKALDVVAADGWTLIDPPYHDAAAAIISALEG